MRAAGPEADDVGYVPIVDVRVAALGLCLAEAKLSASGAARAFQARAPRIERVGVWQLRDYSQEADRRLSYGMPVGFRCEWRR
jgi:hypothetical protein